MTMARSQRGDDRLHQAGEAEHRAAIDLDEEMAAQQVRAETIEAVAPARLGLSRTIDELDDALGVTRPERVVAMTREPMAPTYVAALIGDPPPEGAGRDVWCGLSTEIESYRDSHPQAISPDHSTGVEIAIGPKPKSWAQSREWEGLAKRLGAGRELVDIAGRHALDADSTFAEHDPATWARSLAQAEKVRGASIEVARDEPGFSLGG